MKIIVEGKYRVSPCICGDKPVLFTGKNKKGKYGAKYCCNVCGKEGKFVQTEEDAKDRWNIMCLWC